MHKPIVPPKDFYVYVHKRATDGVVFYVGKGKGFRAWDTRRHSVWKNYVSKYGFVVEILDSGLREWYAFELEKSTIALYGRRNSSDGNLINLTDGGEGNSGFVVSAKTKDLQRKAALNRSSDTRKKMSDAQKLRFSAPGAIDHLSDLVKAHYAKAGVLEMHRERQKLIMGTDKARNSARIAAKKRFAENPKLKLVRAKRVKCNETGQIFESQTSAIAHLKEIGFHKATNSAVSACCLGSRSIAYGFTWSFCD